MLKLLMKSNKALVVTKPQRLYQRETMSNQMCIYIPHELSDYDMEKFLATFRWVDPGNIVHMEILEAEESEKENYLKYVLPVDTKFTALAGENTVKLSLIWHNEDDGRTYTIESSELKIPILAQNDYFAYVTDKDLSSIDQRLAMLQTEAHQLSEITAELPTKMAKDLELNGQTLQLVNQEGSLMGEGVGISTAIDDLDSEHDAIISLDDISDDGSAISPTARAADLKLTDDLLQLQTETGKTIGDGVKIIVVPPDKDGHNDGIYDLDDDGGQPSPTPGGNPEGDSEEDSMVDLGDLGD